MACGCNKAAAMSTATAVAAGSQVYHYVYVSGRYTGRRFTSLLAARSYADRVDGVTSPAAPGTEGAPDATLTPAG